MSNVDPLIIKAVYCGTSNQSGLKVGHEYKFSLNREPTYGYWKATCLDNNVLIIFSGIHAMYNNFKNIRLIKADGTITAF